MKKLISLLTVIVFASAMNIVFGQANDSEVVTINVKMESTMFLNLSTTPIMFDFTSIEDYNNGVAAADKNASNITSGSVVSTSNWSLSVVAQSNMMHSDGLNEITTDNVGVKVNFTGTNKVKNYAKNNPLALETTETVLLGRQGNQSNAGDEDDNSFVIYWEMGTGNGNMQSESLMEQDFKKGSYNMDVAFVLTEVI